MNFAALVIFVRFLMLSHFSLAVPCAAAYGRGPGWIVTKTGMGHGWDDVGTGPKKKKKNTAIIQNYI